MALSDVAMAFDEVTLRQVIDELANGQTAVPASAQVQAALATASDDAIVLQQALKRVHVTFARHQPK